MVIRLNPDRPLKRSSQPKRLPKPDIVIVCEGRKTEPKYFSEFKNLCSNNLVVVQTIGGCGVPISVVRRAIDEREKLVKDARRSRDTFDKEFQVWAVFDRDDHPIPQVPAALQLASENGVLVAYSNPCFELWAMLHFAPCNRPGHHHDMQRQLKAALSGYCHETNPVIDARAIHDRYGDAVRHAEKGLAERTAEGTPHGDPSTTVHKLTETIRLHGRA